MRESQKGDEKQPLYGKPICSLILKYLHGGKFKKLEPELPSFEDYYNQELYDNFCMMAGKTSFGKKKRKIQRKKKSRRKRKKKSRRRKSRKRTGKKL